MTIPVLGPELLINTVTVGAQKDVQLLALANGKYMAVWQNVVVNELGVEQTAIYAQRYYTGGPAHGDPILVNSTSGGIQAKPVVTSLSDGRIVYVWEHQSLLDDGTTLYEIRARIFNENGTPYDNPADDDETGDDDFVVASSTTGPLMGTAISALPDKGFLITYTDSAGDTHDATRDAGVKAVAYTSGGTAYGDPLTLNANTVGHQENADLLSLGGGRFAALYKDRGSDPSDPADHIEVRFFKADGAMIVAEEQKFNFSGSISKNTLPAMAVLKDGRIVIAWTSESGDGSGQVVMAQVFNADGTENGTAFIVNSQRNGHQTGPDVTALSNGGFAISFLDYNNLAVPQVRVARFDHNKTHQGSETTASDPQLQFQQGTRGTPSVIELVDGRIVVAWDEDIPGRARDTDGIRGRIIDARTVGITEYGTSGNDQYAGTNHLADTLYGAGGHDHLNGLGGNDWLDGGVGRDTLNGGAGADTMIGGGEDDVYEVENSGDVVVETAAGGTGDKVMTSISYTLSAHVEHLEATGGASINLTGNGSANSVVGNSGANIIDGGLGSDVLTGGAGLDLFLFKDKSVKFANVDAITDFSVADDTIWLDNAVFTKLGKKGSIAKPQKLNKKNFKAGTKAKDKDDYIVYNKKTGVLSYDADGSGKKKAVEFATLSTDLKLTEKDFFVI